MRFVISGVDYADGSLNREVPIFTRECLAGIPDTSNSYVRASMAQCADELLNESLFFGLDHAPTSVLPWRNPPSGCCQSA